MEKYLTKLADLARSATSGAVWRRRSSSVRWRGASSVFARSASRAFTVSRVALTTSWSSRTSPIASSISFWTEIAAGSRAVSAFRDTVVDSQLMAVHFHSGGVLLRVNSVFDVFISHKAETARLFAFLVVHKLAALHFSISFKSSFKFVLRRFSSQIENSKTARLVWISAISKMSLFSKFCRRYGTAFSSASRITSWAPTTFFGRSASTARARSTSRSRTRTSSAIRIVAERSFSWASHFGFFCLNLFLL